MDISKFVTDETKSKNGVWIEVGDDGAAFLIAKLPNERYSNRVDALQKPYRALLRSGGRIPTDKARDITAQAIAETVLLDWRGITEDGKAVKYSRDKALEWLRDPNKGDFQEFIVMLARDSELFQPDDTVADIKNLKAG